MIRLLVRILALAVLGIAPAVAQNLLDPETVRRDLSANFGVEVLRMERIELDGRPVYLATVMRPGGNSNAAFMVSRIGIDAETGSMLPPIRLDEAGYGLPSAGPWTTETDGRNIRRRTFRE